MSQAINSGIKINQKITSTEKIENRSIVQLEGTNLVKAINNNNFDEKLINNSSDSLNTKNMVIKEGVFN